MSTYNSPSDASPLTRALSATPNNIDAACAAAFALVPDETLMKQGKVTYAVDSANLPNDYTITLAVSPGSYEDGLLISCRPLVTNSGASTINVNGLGVKSIRNIDSTELSAGAIVAGSAFVIVYSTATGYFHLLTSALYQQASGSFATLNGAETLGNKTLDATCLQTVTGINYGTNASATIVLARRAAGIVTLNVQMGWSGAGSLTNFMVLPAGARPVSTVSCAGRLFDASVPAYFGVLVNIDSGGNVSIGTISLDGVLHGVTPANGDTVIFSISFPVA